MSLYLKKEEILESQQDVYLCGLVSILFTKSPKPTSELKHKTTKVEITHPHVGITVDWGRRRTASEGASWVEVEEWEGRQSMSDREEEDHFMGC